MGDPYPITPAQVQPVETANRKIHTAIPHPDSVALLEQLREIEPVCMEGQPPIMWDHAHKATVFDSWGNKWIDFTSGVLITNAGHARKKMTDAVAGMAEQGLLTTYCFPHKVRGELVAKLQTVAPRKDDKVMLLSTGSEATELCIKLSREHARHAGRTPNVFVTFINAFHGRTLGSQLAGGIPALKSWVGYSDTHFLNVPYPDCIRSDEKDNTFDAFLRTLEEARVKPSQVCGVMTETYQGGSCAFLPVEYAQKLRAWCDENDVVLVMDEVQAGFGRTGKFWGFEHYGIKPDLIACGKGISGSLPLSAVIGRKELLDMFPPGSMTSTHSGNPVCAAAALASLEIILEENLVEQAAKLGAELQAACQKIHKRFPDVILPPTGHGMVSSLQCVKPGTKDPDATLAWHVIDLCVKQGLLLFGGVGTGGASVKICPPLCIEAEALREGLDVLESAFVEVIEHKLAKA